MYNPYIHYCTSLLYESKTNPSPYDSKKNPSPSNKSNPNKSGDHWFNLTDVHLNLYYNVL